MWSPDGIRTLQADLAIAVKQMAEVLQENPSVPVIHEADGVTQTEVAIVSSALLAAAQIESFELALWQAWGSPTTSQPPNARDGHAQQ
jgi:hypothetical protein